MIFILLFFGNYTTIDTLINLVKFEGVKKKMKIALSCESTVDLPRNMLEENDIHVMPYTIVFGDEEVEDGEGIAQKVFDYFDKTKELAKTTAINEMQYTEYFEKLLKDYDCVLHITLSSKISSTYINAVKAATGLGENKVRVVDSLSLSTGIALQVLFARKLINEGVELEEIATRVENRRQNDQTSFVLSKLNYMRKGGRCSGMAYFGANLLKIKPEIIMKDGSMVVGKKHMGSLSKALTSYCDSLLQTYPNADKENVFITYSSAEEQDVLVLEKKLQDFGFKNIYKTNAGGTICCHCGPGCLGVLFYNAEEKK